MIGVLVLWFRFQIQTIFKETTTKKISSEMTVNDSYRKQNSYIIIFNAHDKYYNGSL